MARSRSTGGDCRRGCPLPYAAWDRVEGGRPLNYQHRQPGRGAVAAERREAPARSRPTWVASLPNLISVGRLVLVPVIIALILDRHWVGVFALFVAAGASDAVDGYIAKRFNVASELGACLDPLADKALLTSIFITLAATGVLPAWLAVLVVFRDVMIVGAVILALVLGRPMPIRPLPVSKVNTTVQIGVAAIVLGAQAFGLDLGPVLPLSLGLVVALTVGSAAAYLARWLDHMSR